MKEFICLLPKKAQKNVQKSLKKIKKFAIKQKIKLEKFENCLKESKLKKKIKCLRKSQFYY